MKYDKIVFDNIREYTSNCEETGLNNNVLVCGCTGSGKTMSITEPALINTYERNLVVTVTKRTIVDKYRPALERRGYTVRELNFADPTKCTVAYDPLKYVRTETDAVFLARSIVLANPRKEKGNMDPFWDDSAISLLAAEIGAVLITKGRRGTFADVVDLQKQLKIKDGSKNNNLDTSLDSFFEEIEEKYPNSYVNTCWRTFKCNPIKTAGCVFTTLNSAIDTVISGEICDSMKKCISLDFKELCYGKNILFVVTSPVNPASNHFINVFYSDLFKQTFEYAEKLIDGALSRPLHVICDDFATGGQIPNFDQYISIFRAKNISVTLLVQSESQLENMYGESSANCIKNNCDTYVYLGGMDDGTIFSVARKLNKPYDEVMNMPVGRIVLIRRGEKARMTNRYKILENDVYKMISLEYEMEKVRRKKELEKQRVYARTRQSVAAKRNVS